MSGQTLVDESIELSVENIGGITETSVELEPGVTVLSGRNATNRTSLLQAIMAALGSDQATLKGDAEEGRVELSMGDVTYTRILRRRNGKVVSEGDPYLTDATLADLFAFLLESNDARRAVERGDDLRDVAMRPVDTTEIEDEISRLEDERRELTQEIEDIESLRHHLPDLEERKVEIEDEIEKTREALSEKEAEIEKIGKDVEERREEKEELEATLDELSDARSELETVRQELESERESIEALKEERDTLEEELRDYATVPEEQIDDIDAEVRRLRTRQEEIESTVDELQTVIQFNEDILDGNLEIFSDLSDGEDDSTPTDALIEGDREIACWTCGNEIETEQIETMLDHLRDLRDEKMEARNTVESEINELLAEQSELEERQRQRDQMESRLERIETEIEDRQARIEELNDRREDLTDDVEQLETEAEELRSDDQSGLIELHKEANRLEVEISRLETELQDVEEEITTVEERLAEKDELEAEREAIQSEIEELRTRIERIENGVVDQFNEHMETILDRLEYENLERIWLERTEREVKEGQHKVTKGHFELHVVRSMADGTVYEDTVEHLSESEREVTGLMFALAGYLVHDVHEDVPFMILDSVEAIDAERIAKLVEYLDEYAEYLVVALLEEDAAALDSSYERIAEI